MFDFLVILIFVMAFENHVLIEYPIMQMEQIVTFFA